MCPKSPGSGSLRRERPLTPVLASVTTNSLPRNLFIFPTDTCSFLPREPFLPPPSLLLSLVYKPRTATPLVTHHRAPPPPALTAPPCACCIHTWTCSFLSPPVSCQLNSQAPAPRIRGWREVPPPHPALHFVSQGNTQEKGGSEAQVNQPQCRWSVQPKLRMQAETVHEPGPAHKAHGCTAASPASASPAPVSPCRASPSLWIRRMTGTGESPQADVSATSGD